MGSFEPFINVLTVLTVLSVAAERTTNLVKQRQHADLKDEARESAITLTTIWCGVLIALVAKADLFGMLSQPDAPWATLGWTHWDGAHWVRHESAASVAGFTQALLGSVITGFSLGFGSKFWHDVLGIVVELRAMTQKNAASTQAVLEQKTVTKAALMTPEPAE